MILNINNNKIKIEIADTYYKKIKGLQNKTNINYGLFIPNTNHIHTFFMKENIDVIFLNNKNVVIYKYENMPPFRTFKVYEDIKTTSVLELPKNTSCSLKIGDILTFEDEHII